MELRRHGGHGGTVALKHGCQGGEQESNGHSAKWTMQASSMGCHLAASPSNRASWCEWVVDMDVC